MRVEMGYFVENNPKSIVKIKYRSDLVINEEKRKFIATTKKETIKFGFDDIQSISWNKGNIQFDLNNGKIYGFYCKADEGAFAMQSISLVSASVSRQRKTKVLYHMLKEMLRDK